MPAFSTVEKYFHASQKFPDQNNTPSPPRRKELLHYLVEKDYYLVRVCYTVPGGFSVDASAPLVERGVVRGIQSVNVPPHVLPRSRCRVGRQRCTVRRVGHISARFCGRRGRDEGGRYFVVHACLSC